MKNNIKLLLAILIPLAVGGIAGFFTARGVDGWYLTAQKPSFNPPNWIFAPVWTFLYILMGISLFFVWQTPVGTLYRKTAIWIFAIQLALNFFWSFLFFQWQKPAIAFAEIVTLWISIVLMIIYFSRVKTAAGLLQVPYLAWVSFASVLNYYIWQLNA